jgi:nucleoside-diphosphate-sugar epimerase
LCRTKEKDSAHQHHIGDIRESNCFELICEKVDTVVHLASLAHGNFTVQEKKETDYYGLINLLDWAKAKGVKRIIYINTILASKQRPSCNKDDYVFRRMAESSLIKFSNTSQIEYTIIRSPLVYGEGVKANFALLMSFVAKGVPLPFGQVNNNRRSLVSVYNLVDLISICIDNSKAVNQIFEVSDGNDLSTAEMISLMASVQARKNFSIPVPIWLLKLLGSITGKQQVIDNIVGDLIVDLSITKKTLGWEPPYSVEYGFSKSIPKK